MGGNFNFNSAASRAFPATLERVSLIAPIPGKKLSNVKIASLAAAPPFSFPPPGYLYTNFARCAKRKRKEGEIRLPPTERRESSGGKFLRNRLAYKIRFQNLADGLNERSWGTYITIIVVIMSSRTVSKDLRVLGNRETVKTNKGPGDKSF